MPWIILFSSLIVMIFGANWLIRGCVRMAKRIRVSEFIVSVIIIGLGTTAPEILVSILSSAKGYGGLAVGNAIGSNIIRILGIFGIGVLLHPVVVDFQKRKLELYFVLLSAVIMLWTIVDGTVSKFDGMVLIFIFIAYIIAKKIKSSQEINKIKKEYIHPYKIIIPLIAGIVGLYIGSKYFMNALESIAFTYNLDERIMGIFIVATGTSIPELLVTIIAALKKRTGIVLGNILGANIINISLAVGTAAIVAPLTVSKYIISFDIWVMIGVTALFFFQLSLEKKISRFTGIFYLTLLGLYFYLV